MENNLGGRANTEKHREKGEERVLCWGGGMCVSGAVHFSFLLHACMAFLPPLALLSS